MKESLKINGQRFFARRDQVLTVEIRCLKCVQNGQISALPPVETPHFVMCGARQAPHELRPAMAPAFQAAYRTQRRCGAPRLCSGKYLVYVPGAGARPRTCLYLSRPRYTST